MRRAAPLLLLAAALAATLVLRCATSSSGAESVRVTHDRSAVHDCVDLARVTTDLDGDAGEKEMKAKTADLGGNVLLIFNEHAGGAFYCATPPLEVTIPGASPPRYPTPLHPS